MKAMHIVGPVAGAALAAIWAVQLQRRRTEQHRRVEEKNRQLALQTLEGEGGLVVT